MTAVVLAGLFAAGAVLLWPRTDGTAAAAVTAGTAPSPRGARRRRDRRAQRAAVAEALGVLDGIGPALRVGLSPRAALEHLVLADPVSSARLAGELAAAAAAPLTSRGEDGSPVGRVWYRAAQRSDAEELTLVAAAWTLADTCGVALAEAVDLAAALLRDTRSRQSRLDVLLAGPRATMSLLTLLPLAGPVVAGVLGVDPVQLYAGSPLAMLSAVLGVGLLVVGRLWCRALIRRASTAGSPPPDSRPLFRHLGTLPGVR